jgi:hypothetical protein
MRIAPGTALVSLVHLVANALLLLLGYYWLGLSESNAFHLAWSFLVIAVFVATAIWLHGATFLSTSTDTRTDCRTPQSWLSVTCLRCPSLR